MDAHAMSKGIACPSKPKANARRPAVTLPVVPRYPSSCPLDAITSR